MFASASVSASASAVAVASQCARPVGTVYLTRCPRVAALVCLAPFASSLSCFCCILWSVIFIESCCQPSALLRQHGFLLFCTFIYSSLTLSLCEHVLCSSCCCCCCWSWCCKCFVRFVGVTRMRWPFPFPFHGLFLQILFPSPCPCPCLSLSPGESFCINWANNQLCYISFISFRFVSFALTVADGGIPEAAAPACLLLFVPVLLLLKSGFLFVSGGFLYTTLHIYPASLFVFSQVCLCLCVCVCVHEIECSIEHLISKNSF